MITSMMSYCSGVASDYLGRLKLAVPPIRRGVWGFEGRLDAGKKFATANIGNYLGHRVELVTPTNYRR